MSLDIMVITMQEKKPREHCKVSLFGEYMGKPLRRTDILAKI